MRHYVNMSHNNAFLLEIRLIVRRKQSVQLACIITLLNARIAGPTLQAAQLALQCGPKDTYCRQGPIFRAQYGSYKINCPIYSVLPV
jgi:hypothetical protein